jgi:hypothetical protein
MKIMNFSTAATQPFWIAPVQTLAPWIARLKNSLGQTPVLSTAQRIFTTLQPPFAARNAKASNDAAFAIAPQTPVRPYLATSTTTGRDGLRVVRESDSAISPDCAGRMVISGRMADVCAELDRMALRAGAGQ